MTIYSNQIRWLLKTSKNGRIRIGDFCSELPELAEQIRSDAPTPVFDYWGLSSNTDENAGAQIVDRKLLSVIGKLAVTRIRTPVGYHAGLMHTYGYMLSTLSTEFGEKHERWTSKIIENSLGIRNAVFHPSRCRGTLLQNVTFLVGSVIFRSSPRHLKRLSQCLNRVDEELSSYDFGRLKTDTYREQIKVDRNGFCTIETHFSLFPKRSQQSYALATYAIQTPGDSAPKFITCFPISRQSLQQMRREYVPGKCVDVRLRFNACLPKVGQRAFQGTRKVTQEI